MKIRLLLMVVAAILGISACDKSSEPSKPEPNVTATIPPDSSIETILAGQAEENKARYGARRPKETLEFLGIKPGMTVAETLPGGGWYTKILLPYLGRDGHLIGVDYAADMYPKFGFFSDEQLKAKKTWVDTWMGEAIGWRGKDGARISAFQFGRMPQNMQGRADAVLFIRALHNLARFESDGGYLTAALKDTYDVLKPGGMLGVVQHMASEDSSDEWAAGANGYLKKSFVISRLEEAGFEFVESSDININAADQPSEEDFVWRLPPSLVTSKEDPKLREKYVAIGESTRMTLKFRKRPPEPPK